MRPYIGFTGIENRNQLGRILAAYSQNGHIPHLLMVGVITSYKTFIGVKDRPIVLMRDEIKNIFEGLENQPSENVLFALHYSTESLDKVEIELREKAKRIVEKTLYQQISELIEDLYEKYERTQPPFQLGLQINVSWPDLESIDQIKVCYPKLKIILQVSDFTSLEERIERYNTNYILIDASRGRGMEFDIDEAVKIYNVIKKVNSASIGFAGGLSPENVREKVSSIRKKLVARDFSIDAESKLRTRDYLSIRKVERYLKEGIETFRQ